MKVLLCTIYLPISYPGIEDMDCCESPPACWESKPNPLLVTTSNNFSKVVKKQNNQH